MEEERQRNRRTGLSPVGLSWASGRRPGSSAGTQGPRQHGGMPTWLLGRPPGACLGQHHTQSMQHPQNTARGPGQLCGERSRG